MLDENDNVEYDKSKKEEKLSKNDEKQRLDMYNLGFDKGKEVSTWFFVMIDKKLTSFRIHFI